MCQPDRKDAKCTTASPPTSTPVQHDETSSVPQTTTTTQHDKNSSTSFDYHHDARTPNPYLEASWFSRLMFTWPYDLLKLGMERPIEEQDLPHILSVDASEANRDYLQRLWKDECSKRKKPSLHRALLSDFIKSLWYVQPLMCASSIARVVQSLALGQLVQAIDTDRKNNDGYLWAGVLSFCAMVVLFEHHHVFFITWRKGMRLRIASVALIYDKCLRLSSTQSADSTSSLASSGQVINLATNDVNRFLMAALFIFYLFWAPIQSFAILGVGIAVLGPAFIAGFLFLIIFFVPLQFVLSQRFAQYRSRVAAVTDKRVTLLSQAIYGVRVMKMSGWEDQFQERIAKIRREEIRVIAKANRLKAWNEALFFSANVVIAILVFVIHVFWFDDTLSPRTVFATMSLINLVQIEMTKHVSLAVMAVSECYVSITRIQKFLEYPETKVTQQQQLLEVSKQLQESQGETNKSEDDAAVMSLSNVTCYWNEGTQNPHQAANKIKDGSLTEQEDQGKTTEVSPLDTSTMFVALDKVSLDLCANKLTCVIGTVGSGKSALLQAVVGELPVSSGSLEQRDCTTIAYAAQDPWIMDGTVRENILMGHEWNSKWYDEVVKSCGLLVDFDQFRHGDLTIVGDRGVQCSGGQRARIGLARALYRNADILVADDPLSAVDAKVGRIIFHEAILGLGVNRGKCVVLATHQHQYIGDYRCVLMVGGKMECVGSYNDCVKASGGKLTAHTADDDIDKVHSRDSRNSTADRDGKLDSQAIGAAAMDEEDGDGAAAEDDEDGKEMNITGLVRWDTFLNYARAMGGVWMGVALLFLFAVTQASVLVTIAVLGKWAERPEDEQDSMEILGLVIGLGSLVIILALLRSLLSFELTVKASQRLHDGMTASVLRAKIEFFDTNPLGRILNRFSADVGSNDDLLPHTLFDFLMTGFVVLGAIITAISVLPFTLVAIPPLLCYFLSVRRIFVTTTRELKRLEGMARSPIFAMLSESLSGIATIRANDALKYFMRKFDAIHDAHTRSFFAFISSSRWVGFRMDGLMFLFLAVASFLAVLFDQQGWFNVDPAVLGLSLTMLLQLAGIFQWCIRQSAEVDNQMVSVERVLGFGNLPPEAPLRLDSDAPLLEQNWPHEGSIDVQDLSVRYRASLPLSLKEVSFRIEPGQRVGVVGRTGSGKSTLVQCLFRLLEAQDGSIHMDGVNIAHVGLHTLRTQMSVIPQFPVLFSGCTVRENLDPFQKHSDRDLREALEDVHMTHVLDELPDGWNSMVSEGGSNFSVGQRQLLCLARAILCKNKVLVLDEPTANVDRRTDELLQEALQKSFKGSTILSVAHRLDTVIENDKILVLGHGEVLEYGTPANLLDDKSGHFSSMVNDTGATMSQDLRRRAYHKRSISS